MLHETAMMSADIYGFNNNSRELMIFSTALRKWIVDIDKDVMSKMESLQ